MHLLIRLVARLVTSLAALTTTSVARHRPV
jgi:hypothetical protein